MIIAGAGGDQATSTATSAGRRSSTSSEDIDIEDLIVEEDMVVTVSHAGYIKRIPVSLYKSQRRGGKGKIGMGTKEEDFVEHLFIASTHHYLLFFTNKGRVYWLKVHEIPQAGRAAAREGDRQSASTWRKGSGSPPSWPSGSSPDDKSVVMVTRQGTIKKTELSASPTPARAGSSPSPSTRGTS